MSLDIYKSKRDFKNTSEPGGLPRRYTPRNDGKRNDKKLIFVVQKHQASHLHFDFRLEDEGVLKSWAVPKGPPEEADEKRLAVAVEDHPIEYAKFHGRIPEGNYGAGTVEIWDKGTYETKFRDEGMWEIFMKGKKLKGYFTLVKTKGTGNSNYAKNKNNWLLIKNKETIKEGPISDPPESMPHRVKPMLATLTNEPFDKENWLFEIKWDGYRAISEIENGKVKLYSRNLLPFEDRFPTIYNGLKKINHNCVLDGEIVALDDKGKPSFQYLQDFKKDKRGELVYYVFDILYLDGKDVQNKTLFERKKLLDEIIPKKGPITIGEAVEKEGIAFYKAAERQNIEGIMAKDGMSHYLQGVRGNDWLKIKTHLRQEAIICGFTEPRGSREKFGSLVLGVVKGKDLTYIGHTGTGFDEESLIYLFNKLKPLAQNKSPFANPPETNMPVTWVKPKLICEVKFAEWTKGGLMRQPVFLGLREDKVTKEVIKEVAK